jgi:hypothetical protein
LETPENEVGPKLENVEPEDCLSTESLLIPSLMICKAANTWLDSGKELKENLRSRVYTLMRDVAKVPFASPPKPKRLSSNFEASCGLTRESSSTYSSIPSLMICKAANTWLDSGKELYVDELSQTS